MDEENKALDGFSADLFAGIPVKDIQLSTHWYEKLLGSAPSFFPNDLEAVWQLADHQWLYVIQEPERAGGSIQTIMGKDVDGLVDQISERGINFDKEEIPAEGVRKVMYYDPDGNEIGFGSAPEE